MNEDLFPIEHRDFPGIVMSGNSGVIQFDLRKSF